MPSYEQALAYWRAQKLETAADIDRVLDWFKVSFAFQSGRLSDPQITYRDTVSIFEKDSVIEYTGVVRSLLEQRNQRLCYEFTRARLVERAILDIPSGAAEIWWNTVPPNSPSFSFRLEEPKFRYAEPKNFSHSKAGSRNTITASACVR